MLNRVADVPDVIIEKPALYSASVERVKRYFSFNSIDTAKGTVSPLEIEIPKLSKISPRVEAC